MADSDAPNPIFETAEAVLSSAWRALSVFDGTAGITTYVSHNEPPADCCDALIVWASDYGPTAKSTAREMNSAGATGLPIWTETTFRVVLWESCYPTVDDGGGRIQLPDPAVLHARNRLLYAHGFAIYSGVTCDYRRGNLFIEPRTCPRLVFTKLRPVGPNGGCAGWTFDVIGDLDGTS